MVMTREEGRDAAIHRALDGVSPELARVLAADREHPLNMTTALDDPERRERVLDLLAEMARGEIVTREPLVGGHCSTFPLRLSVKRPGEPRPLLQRHAPRTQHAPCRPIRPPTSARP